MSLFKKETCALCGAELKLKKYKLPDSGELVCGDCFEKRKREETEEKKTNSLQTAEAMFAYCSIYGCRGKAKAKWAIPDFRLIEKKLEPEETVHTVFTGLHNYESMSKHEGNCAYAMTNRRFIMAQKSVLRGVRSMAIPYPQILTILRRHTTGIVVLELATEEGKLQIGLDKNYAEAICRRMKKVFDQHVKGRTIMDFTV